MKTKSQQVSHYSLLWDRHGAEQEVERLLMYASHPHHYIWTLQFTTVL